MISRPSWTSTEAQTHIGNEGAGRRGLGALERFLLGSVSTKLIQHATCPVLVVKDDAVPLRRMTLAIDGSPASAHALRRWLAYRLPSKAEHQD